MPRRILDSAQVIGKPERSRATAECGEKAPARGVFHDEDRETEDRGPESSPGGTRLSSARAGDTFVAYMPPSPRVRVAVLGAGAWARFAHLPGISATSAVSWWRSAIRSVLWRRTSRAEFRFRSSSTDHTAIIAREDIDLIDVCTPSATHFELAWSALEAGKHVLCEKPVAFDFRDTLRAAWTREVERGEDETRLYVSLLAGDALHESDDRRRLRRHAVHIQRLRAELAVDRSVHAFAAGRSHSDQSVLQVSSLEGYGAPIIDLGCGSSGSRYASVVGTMRNFVPERVVRATGKMTRMNIDDGDIFIGEFENGALGSVQTSFVTVGNYPGLEARVYGSEGAIICRLVEERGVCESLKVATKAEVEFREVAVPAAILSAGRQPARVVAHALLRQPRLLVHRGDSGRRRRKRGRFSRRRLRARGDQRSGAFISRAPLGHATVRCASDLRADLASGAT